MNSKYSILYTVYTVVDTVFNRNGKYKSKYSKLSIQFIQ